MAEYVDSAVQTVLSSSRLKLAHPGNAKLTQVYPTPSETTSVLAQSISHRGQFRVSPNNKNFNARSDFILSSSALISEIAIQGSVSFTNNGANQYWLPNAEGWSFDMVESIEITFSNSLMQNMFIRGETLKDYSLLTCCSSRDRQDMLKAAGSVGNFSKNNADTNVFEFSLPISFLNFTPASLKNSWPVDGSVLAGPIQISVNWRTIGYGFVKAAGAAAAPPASFTTLELSCKTVQLQDASFSVKKAMMLDPQLVYSLPSRYITSVDYSANFVDGAFQTINLASAPSGMLEGILLSIRPKAGVNWTTPSPAFTSNIIGGSVRLTGLEIEFGGQYLFRANSSDQIDHWMRSSFGDDLKWTNVLNTPNVATHEIDQFTSRVGYVHNIYFIPFVNDGAAVFRGHTNENLPSYGGSQIQMRVRAGATTHYAGSGNNETITYERSDLKITSTGATAYEVWVAYIVSGLLEISQGTVDLQL